MDENCEITRVQTDEDVATLRNLMRQFGAILDTGEICDDAIHHRAALKKNLVGAGALAESWLSRQGETAVGYVLFYWTFASFSGKRNLYIEDLFGPGVGRQLLQYVAERAMQEGCDKIGLCHPTTIGKLHEYYTTLGFETEAEGPVWTYMRYALGRVEPLKELSQYWASKQKTVWSAHFMVTYKDRNKWEDETNRNSLWRYRWHSEFFMYLMDVLDHRDLHCFHFRCGLEREKFRNCAPPPKRYHGFHRICAVGLHRLIAEPELEDLALNLKVWCDKNDLEFASRFEPADRQISRLQRGRMPGEFEFDVIEADHDLYDEADRVFGPPPVVE
ncbi:MAG: GNAT family N-acetyltransferase [Pirellulaceae bacterium]